MPHLNNGNFMMEENNTRTSPSNPQGPTDFIQKLFRLVNDPISYPLACWSNNGDSFLISNPHDFAKLLLPKHFKHDNFQSFIRQLNKYGFSKVKRVTDDKIWEFKHENFCRDSIDSLKDIRRKAAATRRVSVNNFEGKQSDNHVNLHSPALTLNGKPIDAQGGNTRTQNDLETIIRTMQERINKLESKTNTSCSKNVEDKYNRLIKEVENLSKNMIAQDELMQSIIQCIVSQEKALMLFVDNQWRQDFNPPMNSQAQVQPDVNQVQPQQPFLSANIQRLVNTYKQVSKANGQFLNDFTQAAQDYYSQSFNLQGMPNQNIPVSQDYSSSFNNVNLVPVSTSYNFVAPEPVKQEIISQKPVPNNSLKANMKRKALAEKRSKTDANSTQSLAWTWIVPPNVLLVDDDPTCQAIYARSLQILGCSYDIAKDGSEAVNKMKSRKYDMVLMDIWMPEMDGLSATKLIREFDAATPIIAITGDYREEDRNFYLEQGINEVLGKPLRVKELGPIMQKHWLKFCINRDAETQQNQTQLSNDMTTYNNEYSINNNELASQIIPTTQIQQNVNQEMRENITFNPPQPFFNAQISDANYNSGMIAQTYYQPNPSNQ
ncbi:hypothetical protein K502DRAFT_319117 [Neoconidiobolus thromboides FSU 785]|nr:hypothetical protein K502DRAFT_319117 [Neoconidiobolus thromboides FSU 785]